MGFMVAFWAIWISESMNKGPPFLFFSLFVERGFAWKQSCKKLEHFSL
jgi:hypothetical protein